MVTTVLSLLLAAGQVANDDRDVIQAAMLRFYHRETWLDSEWKPKKHVFLYAELHKNDGETFENALQMLWIRKEIRRDHLRKDLKEHRDLNHPEPDLSSLEKEVALLAKLQNLNSLPVTYKPAPSIPLGQMSWNPRIVLYLGENSWITSDPNLDLSQENRPTIAYPWQPLYSPDGNFALVKLGLQHGRHGASVTFLFGRTSSGWKQKSILADFYL